MSAQLQRPPSKANASVQHHRKAFIVSIDRQIETIDNLLNNQIVSDIAWFETDGEIHYQLSYMERALPLNNGDELLKASSFEDLVTMLEQIQIIAAFGGMDHALAECAAAAGLASPQ